MAYPTRGSTLCHVLFEFPVTQLLVIHLGVPLLSAYADKLKILAWDILCAYYT